MSLTREDVLIKLTDFLNNKIPKAEIHEWALLVATAEDFEQTAQRDPLIGKTIQCLIDINHNDIKYIPTPKALEYYRRCLTGEEIYQPLEQRRDLHKIKIPEMKLADVGEPPEVIRRREWWQGVLWIVRIYVILFAMSSLAIDIAALVQPELFRGGEDIPSRLENFKESYKQMIYAFFILLPPTILSRRPTIYLSLPIVIWGVYHYWEFVISKIDKLPHPMFLLAFLPFSAIPAAMALFLLLVRWKEGRAQKTSDV
jgi:hypothetical protein